MLEVTKVKPAVNGHLAIQLGDTKVAGCNGTVSFPGMLLPMGSVPSHTRHGPLGLGRTIAK